ncbi:MAG: hypothetical protein HUU50_00585 [Candidatus Brocadiae bacterium]|nr:hypothetical protein [Candidatus Brocadiia bacterium]
MLERIHKIGLFLVFCLFISCASYTKQPSETQKLLGQEMWLVTNLRVFENNHIYWQNYGHGKILSLGTSIRLIRSTSDTVSFLDNQSNEYTLYWRKDAKSEWEKEMPKYFSQKDTQEAIQSLEEDWQKEIFFGNVQKGMTKEMVLWSRGYPVLPSDYEKEDIWMYYENQAKQVLIYFENNAVVHIVGP